MAIYVQILGKAKAHDSRGKLKISRCSLVKDNTIV